MKLGIGAVVLGVLLSVGARAGERAPAQRDAVASVSALDSASPASVTLPWMPTPADVCQGPAAWGQLRHGDLWADYCESAPCAATPQPVAPRRTWWPWAEGDGATPRSCHAEGCARCVPFSRLYQLLGWQPRWWRRAACTHQVCAREPRASYHVDDHDPALVPLPAEPTPRPRDQSRPSPHAEIAPPPTDPPLLTAPLPSVTVPAEEAPAPPVPATPLAPPQNDVKSVPVPTDDPAPEPQLDIPRNKLPALKRAPADAPSPYRPTAVAGRLSDFIRVR